MISIAELKSIVKPQDIARYFLGAPEKERRNELWYKSPFREETDASFVVSDRGLHDFGTGNHYDIVSFTQKIKRCGFKEAVKILASIYGLEDREESIRLTKWLQEQRRKNEEYKARVEKAYLDIWQALEEEQKDNRECLRIFAGDFSDDTYKICLDKDCYITGFIEYLVNDVDTFKEKESLYKQIKRGDIPRWLKMKLLSNTMGSMIMGTTQNQRKEF